MNKEDLKFVGVRVGVYILQLVFGIVGLPCLPFSLPLCSCVGEEQLARLNIYHCANLNLSRVELVSYNSIVRIFVVSYQLGTP